MTKLTSAVLKVIILALVSIYCFNVTVLVTNSSVWAIVIAFMSFLVSIGCLTYYCFDLIAITIKEL